LTLFVALLGIAVNGVLGDHGEEARNLHSHYLGTA